MSVVRTFHHRRMRRLRGRRPGTSSKALFGFALAPLLLIALGAGAGVIAAGATYVAGIQEKAISPAEAISQRGGGARILDRNGVLLYEFLDEEYGHQERVKLDAVSPLIRDATVAAEDASFYSNPGVNYKGLVRASIENFKPGDEFLQGSGGSSITQQLVKQIYFTEEERQARSIDRKIREAAIALEITRDHSKDQILEWYLNEIPYGGIFRGIEAASQGYFSIPARDVTLAQAAFLAGLPQSPSEYDPFLHMDAAKARQVEVLDLMAKHGFISQTEADWAKFELIELRPKPRPFLAPHFVLYVGDYIRATLGEAALLQGGLEVTTTLDLKLQTMANENLEEQLDLYENSSQGHNGSVVVIEPPTGQILAMVGSRDYFRDDINGRVNNALALNSPGSALKPFTYATAFKQGWGPEWPIIDSAITFKEADGKTFSPRNPDGRNRGVMPLKQALGNSFNIPAFKTILWTGVPEMLATAKAMGITTLDRDLGPATTLGGVDVKLIDMVYAYSTFANNGVQAGVPTTAALPEGNRKLDPISVLTVRNRKGETIMNNSAPRYEYPLGPEYAYMITDILSKDENRQITYGRGSNLNIPGHRVAVKTGTSEPFEGKKLIGDTWTVGYTPGLAIGVWVGNSDNSPMVNILSTTIAGSTWHNTFVEALEGKPARDFVKPAGIIEATVCVPSGRRPVEGKPCTTVKGQFAEEAISNKDDRWWGGQTLSAPAAFDPRAIPPDITGLKRQLAEEYMRSRYGAPAPAPARRAPAPPPPAAPAQPQPPREQNNGNGNGNGNNRDRGDND